MNTIENQSEDGATLQKIERALKSISERLDEQSTRIARLESIAGAPAISPSGYSETAPKSADAFSPPPPPPPSPAAVPVAGEPAINGPARSEALEEQIGGKIFARVGIVALILGVTFFLKYAFDNNWIGETGRVILGVTGGLVLLGLGEKTIRKYPAYGQIISGGGIAMLYLSIFAAQNFYQLIGQLPAFFFMLLVTAVGVALSIRYDSIPLIAWAIIGGFATPFLVSSGRNQQFELFSYVLLLDLAILAVSAFKKWREINLLGFIGTAIVFSAWAAQFYSDTQLAPTMFFLTLYFLIFSLSSLIYNLLWNEKSSGAEQVLTLFSATAYFVASYALLNKDFHFILGFFSCFLALYYLVWAYFVRQFTPEDKSLYNFLAFLAIGFVTLAVPLQFDKNIITIGWTVEALVLFYLSAKIRNELFEKFSLIVFALVIFRLLLIDSMLELSAPILIFNERFATFAIAISGSYAAAYIFRYRFMKEIGEKATVQIKQIMLILLVSANVLTIFAGSQEIIGFYGEEIKNIESARQSSLQSGLNSAHDSYGRQLSPNVPYSFGETSYDYQAQYEQLKKVRNNRDITLSLFWLFYAIVILVIGFSRKYKGARVGGLLLLILAILKLFFYDLWSLGTLYRIISSISLGVVLLSISFAYQKYKDKLKEIIT